MGTSHKGKLQTIFSEQKTKKDKNGKQETIMVPMNIRTRNHDKKTRG